MSDKQIKTLFFLALLVGVIGYSFFTFKKESNKFEQKVEQGLEAQKKIILSDQAKDMNGASDSKGEEPLAPVIVIDPFKIEISGEKSKIGICTKIIFKVYSKDGKPLENSSFNIKLMDADESASAVSDNLECSNTIKQENNEPFVQIQNAKSVFEKYGIFSHKGKIKLQAYTLNGKLLMVDDSKAPYIDLNDKLLKIEAQISPKSIVPFSSIDFEFSLKDSNSSIYEGIPKEISLYLAKNEKGDLKDAILLDRKTVHKGIATFTSIFVKDTPDDNFLFIASIDKDISSKFLIKKEPFKVRNISISISDKKGLFAGKFVEPRVVEAYGKRYPVIEEADKLYVIFEDKKYEVEIVDLSQINLKR